MENDGSYDWRKELEFWIKVYDLCNCHIRVAQYVTTFIKDRIAMSLEGLMKSLEDETARKARL